MIKGSLGDSSRETGQTKNRHEINSRSPLFFSQSCFNSHHLPQISATVTNQIITLQHGVALQKRCQSQGIQRPPLAKPDATTHRPGPHSPLTRPGPTHHSLDQAPLTTHRPGPHSPITGLGPTHHSQAWAPPTTHWTTPHPPLTGLGRWASVTRCTETAPHTPLR